MTVFLAINLCVECATVYAVLLGAQRLRGSELYPGLEGIGVDADPALVARAREHESTIAPDSADAAGGQCANADLR